MPEPVQTLQDAACWGEPAVGPRFPDPAQLTARPHLHLQPLLSQRLCLIIQQQPFLGVTAGLAR